MELENIIELNVTAQDIQDTKSFCGTEYCMLGRAAVRQIGIESVSEAVIYIELDGARYDHEYFGNDRYEYYKANPQPFTIILTKYS